MDFNLFTKLLNEDREYVFDIHTAASIGCEDHILQILRSDRKCLNRQNVSGWTPLMYAACFPNIKIIGLFIKEGANFGLKNKLGHNALIIAAKCGNVEAVGMLIDAGTQVNDRDRRGYSAVSHAASFGHRSVVQLLIEKGASIDVLEEDGLTPLMLASAAGHEMIVKDLLKLGANVSIQSKSGDTAKSLAAKNGHSKVKGLLDDFAGNQRNHHMTKPNTSGGYNLQMLLQDLRLSKYYPLFEKEEIDLDVFWMLSEDDLKKIGIQIVGPRKTMCNAIAEQHQRLASAGNDPQALRALNNKLLFENKRLQQAKEELESKFDREIEMRKAAEQNLNEGIKTLKNFSDAVLRTMSYSVALQEKLKQAHDNLKRIFFKPGSNWTQIRLDIVLPIVDHMEKLINEIHHQSQLSLQQTTFRN